MSSKLKKGICVLKCEQNHIHGVVFLSELVRNGPVFFQVHIRRVEPGKHGFHIHRLGNIIEGSHSLCDHFNPTNKNHGNINAKNSHVGDLGNILVKKIRFSDGEEIGIADVDFVADKVRLRGKKSVLGRSLVLHENEDDLGMGNFIDSKSTGHSGKRILWGIIGVDEESRD